MISTNGEIFIPGLPLGFVFRAGIAVDAYANAIPAAGSHGQVSFCRLYREIRILSFIRIRVTQYQRSLSLTNHSLFWDGAPGGTQNLASYTSGIPNINLPYLVKVGLRLNTSVSANSRFCFIPSVSALDMATMNLATLSSVYSGGIAFPANASRTANFIASEPITFTNQAHPGFTSRSASWIFQEMQGINNSLNCAPGCAINTEGLSIIPAAPVCASGVTYSVSGLPAGTPVRWTSSDVRLLAFTNPNSGQATVDTRFVGPVTIRATFGNCSNSIVRQVWVGTPSGAQLQFHNYTGAPRSDEICPGCNVGFSVSDNTNTRGINSYNWIVEGGTIVWESNGYIGVQANFFSNMLSITCIVSNNCGSALASGPYQFVISSPYYD